MNLPANVHVRAPGTHRTIKTVEQALQMIDRELAPEAARLPRWTFARALLVEAEKTGKSRDLNVAFRQLRQALSNERLLADE
jgi:environmental stress-induced protein Ves